jgi:DNA/RNA endonuclease YhcR with UshA esterase domain
MRRITAVMHRPMIGSATSRPRPTTAAEAILIWGDSRTKFPQAPEKRYDGKDIAATGVVNNYRGTSQIVINTPSAIESCG